MPACGPLVFPMPPSGSYNAGTYTMGASLVSPGPTAVRSQSLLVPLLPFGPAQPRAAQVVLSPEGPLAGSPAHAGAAMSETRRKQPGGAGGFRHLVPSSRQQAP